MAATAPRTRAKGLARPAAALALVGVLPAAVPVLVPVPVVVV